MWCKNSGNAELDCASPAAPRALHASVSLIPAGRPEPGHTVVGKDKLPTQLNIVLRAVLEGRLA